ncbi:hypothetical protein HID58_040721 [Brassica napus]|uniref:Origin recognition complex subunit 1 n=1 Tax=Brassica napus TaxID=3708 RepID=A0ABQ8B952_BRANA|nr:hypothetical protein HID58_040721 [Brassica napus]
MSYKNLKAEVEPGNVSPYCFVEINGLILASPEKIYTVIYESLKTYKKRERKALHTSHRRTDLLVTKNQSVLHNILDWPTKPNSKLILLGIANIMNLPAELLPQISNRKDYVSVLITTLSYKKIISTRFKAIDAFENQAIEFASRKVVAI